MQSCKICYMKLDSLLTWLLHTSKYILALIPYTYSYQYRPCNNKCFLIDFFHISNLHLRVFAAGALSSGESHFLDEITHYWAPSFLCLFTSEMGKESLQMQMLWLWFSRINCELVEAENKTFQKCRVQLRQALPKDLGPTRTYGNRGFKWRPRE